MARQFLNPRTILSRLVAEGEHQRQDFKYKITDACKLAKSVSAFANTEGGRLLIGVRDDGHLSGVRSEEEVFMMTSAAQDYCLPAVVIHFDTYISEGKTIVVANVPRAAHRPVRSLCSDGRWRAYIRIADENILASPVHIKMWKEESSEFGHLVSIGETERRVMEVMEHERGLPLKTIVKMSGEPYQSVVLVIARLVRYGLASCMLCDGVFLFRLES